jgi:hypothetical protein
VVVTDCGLGFVVDLVSDIHTCRIQRTAFIVAVELFFGCPCGREDIGMDTPLVGNGFSPNGDLLEVNGSGVSDGDCGI